MKMSRFEVISMRYDYGIQKAIRNMSRGLNMLTMPSMATGSMQSASAKARVAKKKCAECLWNWENVHTGKGRVCYNNMSERYHQKAGGKACWCFETRVPETFGDKLV